LWVLQADVTPLLRPAGQVNRLSYQGLYQGRQPAPRQTPGAIRQEASLVLYTRRGAPGRLHCRVVQR
jgi:hypothetical protein